MVEVISLIKLLNHGEICTSSLFAMASNGLWMKLQYYPLLDKTNGLKNK